MITLGIHSSHLVLDFPQNVYRPKRPVISYCFYWPWQIHLPPFQAEHFFFLHFFFFFLSPIRVKIYYLILLDDNSSCWTINFISNRQNTLINKLNSIFIGWSNQPIKSKNSKNNSYKNKLNLISKFFFGWCFGHSSLFNWPMRQHLIYSPFISTFI